LYILLCIFGKVETFCRVRFANNLFMLNLAPFKTWNTSYTSIVWWTDWVKVTSHSTHYR